MNTVDKVKCPNCGTGIDVNVALSHEIEEQLKIEYTAQNKKHLAEIEKLQKEKEEIEATISKEKEKEYTNRLQIHKLNKPEKNRKLIRQGKYNEQ